MVKSDTSSVSSFVIIVFFFMLVGLIFTINFYQDTRFSKTSTDSKEYVLNLTSLNQLSKIRIKNFQGTLELKQKNQYWDMISPIKVSINQEKLKLFFDILSKLKIKKILKNDLINRTNYSIESPLAEIHLVSQEGEEDFIKFGIHNSINQTCYISAQSSNQIFQIENCHSKILTVGPGDFLLHSPFALNYYNLQEVYLEYYNREKLNLKKASSLGWLGDKNLLIAQNELQNYLDHLSSLRSLSVIRQVNKSQEKVIQKAFSNTTAKLKLIYEGGETILYQVSSSLKSLDGYNFPRWGASLVKKENEDVYYLMSNDDLKKLNVRVKSGQSGVMKLSY